MPSADVPSSSASPGESGAFAAQPPAASAPLEEVQARLGAETVLYAALIAVAALMRLLSLGLLPLGDREAVYALAAASGTQQASAFWPGAPDASPASPLYESVTRAIFTIFGADGSKARLLPAVAGLALLLTPLLLRASLGRSKTFLLFLLLLTSAVALFVSRLAGGESLAAAAVVAAVCLFVGEEPRWRSLFWAVLSIALASGTPAFTGLLGFGVMLAGLGLLARLRPDGDGETALPSWRSLLTPSWIGAAVLAALLTGFGTDFSGVARFTDGLGAWLHGWTQPQGLPALTALVALVVYEPLITLAALGGIWFSLRGRLQLGRLYGAWAAGAVLAVLAYPSRQPADLIWIVVPLAVYAASFLSSVLAGVAEVEERPLLWAMVGLLLVLTFFLYLETASRAVGFAPLAGLSFGLAVGPSLLVLGLAGVMLALIGLGWSWKLAYLSATLALSLAAGAASLSAAWHLSLGTTAATSMELLRPEASTRGLPLMVDVLESISQANTGRATALPVAVVDTPTSDLAWALRDFQPAPAQELEGDASPPPMILAIDTGASPALPAKYLGQSFTISQLKGWPGVLPPNLANWVITRQAPYVERRWILLVRADVAGDVGDATPP